MSKLIGRYDKPGTFNLLEGKRAVSPTDQHKLIGVGKLLADSTKHVIFRSGNAKGADYYFSQGIAQVDSSQLQVITPYRGHRSKSNAGHNTFSLDDVDLSSEPNVIFQTKNSSNVTPLIDAFLKVGDNALTVKARYLHRYTIKVVGTSML